MDFERKTVVRAICLNRNPQFRTSKHCPLACVFGISVGVVQNPKLWILEIGSEFRNLDFARTLCPKSKTLDFGNWIGISEFGFCAYVIPLSISRNFWDLGWREYTRTDFETLSTRLCFWNFCRRRPKSKTLDFGNWIGISEFGFCAYVMSKIQNFGFWKLDRNFGIWILRVRYSVIHIA